LGLLEQPGKKDKDDVQTWPGKNLSPSPKM
jgi:hypothetical protein